MKKLLLASILAAMATATMAESLVKAGLWEVRMVKQTMDGQDMSAMMATAHAEMRKAMASMPPEKRKQMEQMLGQQSGSDPSLHKVCVSREMAAQDKPMLSGASKCAPSKMDRNGNKLTFEISCDANGQKMDGKGESVGTGDTVTTKAEMHIAGPQGKHTMQSESLMKFISADCGGLKPADQLVREMQASQKK